MKKVQAFLKASAKDKAYMLGEYILYQRIFNGWKKRYNFDGKFDYLDRSKKAPNVVLIVIGYKNYLWDSLFEQNIQYIPKQFDVCLCIPGKIPLSRYRYLSSKATNNGWSLLQTHENKLSLAQNLAIRLHQNAEYIFKLDEDIFIGKDYFNNLRKTYEKVIDDGLYRPTIVVPTLNVNGHNYIHVLDHFEAKNTFARKFHSLQSACSGIPIHSDPEAALFMWKLGAFNRTVKEYAQKYHLQYHPCPHRYSIGAFLMKRDVFNMLGGFSVAPEGILGTEEEELAVFATKHSMPIIVSEQTFAGHFCFGLQENIMKSNTHILGL